MMKRTDQALAGAARARARSSFSFLKCKRRYILLFAGRYDEAMPVEIVVPSEKTFPLLAFTWLCISAKGEYREAMPLFRSIKLGGDSPSVQIYLGDSYARAGERGKALSILKQMQTTRDPVSPTELAILYSSLGEMDQAFASLEKAHAAHDALLPWIASDPAYRSLRDDGRYADFVRKVGLQP